jgi:hypothetical protein
VDVPSACVTRPCLGRRSGSSLGRSCWVALAGSIMPSPTMAAVDLHAQPMASSVHKTKRTFHVSLMPTHITAQYWGAYIGVCPTVGVYPAIGVHGEIGIFPAIGVYPAVFTPTSIPHRLCYLLCAPCYRGHPDIAATPCIHVLRYIPAAHWSCPRVVGLPSSVSRTCLSLSSKVHFSNCTS